MTESPFVDSGFDVPVFSPGDDPIAYLNKAMAFLTVVTSSRFPSTNNQLRTSFNLRNQATIQDSRVTVQQVLGRQGQNYSGTTYKGNATSLRGNTTSGQARFIKCYNCQGEGLMARQCTQPKRPRNAAWYKEKAIIPAGQAQTIIPHNASFQTEDLDTYDSDCDDLSTHKRFLWPTFPIMVLMLSQREKLALKEQIDSLEQNLSKQIKEKESVLQTFVVFKNESKEKDNKYKEKEIDLEKKIKELDNIICKVGYQNSFYLKKTQRIKPTLYDGVVMSNTHVVMPVIDDEETLILEEESRSKMSEKAKDPEVIAKKISLKPIDYEKLNRLTQDFRKCFSPQQELSAEQDFWFHILNPTIKPSYTPPVIVDVPSELPKVGLVNASLKKLKFHLTQFDIIMKKRTTPNALEEGEWGFEQTKTIFHNEINPFLKSLKDIFNVFDKDLLNEITEVQTVFDQMEVAVQQSSVDKQCLEIAKKEILLENDRLLQKIMSQDVLLTMMNSISLNNDFVNMEMQKCESCEKCLNLDAELSKSKQAYNDLLKHYSQLEKHCISLKASMQLKQEVFQNNESCVSQNVVEIPEYFEINDLKARLQDKDKTICKLKDTIKSLRDNTKEDNVNHDKCDLDPINKELENSVAKLLSENERLCHEINHVKHVFKDQFDSLKQTRVHHKEQSDSLINKLNLKSVENDDLKAQIQDKVFVITSLKNDLRKLKGKEIVENVIHTPSATTIALGMFKLDLVLLPPRELDFACKYATRIQELLVYVQDTCPIAIKPSTKKVAVSPMNKVKKVRFAEPLTSSSNIKQVESSNTSDSNTPVLFSTGVKCFTSNCGSKPLGNKRNDKISQTPSRNKKNKVEAQPRKVNKMNRVVKPVCDVDVKHSPSNANSEILYATCCPDYTLIARIIGYGDYQLGNVVISRVYYIEVLEHNLFSVGQFCDADLEVAFRKNTCFIRNLEGVDLLSGSRDTNLYTISLDDMLKSSPIYLLSKASKTKSWLWHRRLSHLNFGTLNKLAKDGHARGIPRLKFQKDYLCSACALGKSKKSSHQPKAEDTNQEKLYLLHMDLCGLMRVASINGKRYILVIVDDYSRFTCVRFLKTKDEAPSAIIKSRTPQQNGVVERRNRTLVEAARTILIFSKAPLFLWAEAINTTCYTQTRSLIQL
ncbi:retrovirus-related pol polyprotein from transposon TNT 1-94 [Tanacetum coccineum]